MKLNAMFARTVRIFSESDISGLYEVLSIPMWMDLILKGPPYDIRNIYVTDEELNAEQTLLIENYQISGNKIFKLIADTSEKLHHANISTSIQFANKLQLTDINAVDTIIYNRNVDIHKDTSIMWTIEIYKPLKPITIHLSYTNLKIAQTDGISDISQIILDISNSSETLIITNNSYYPSSIAFNITSDIINYNHLIHSDDQIY